MTPAMLLACIGLAGCPALALHPFRLPAPAPMPLTKLTPAPSRPGDCVLHYRVSTSSPECQQFFDQGLGNLYSYIWPEAARAFEVATRHDPNCAMAWWALSRAMDLGGRGDATKALQKAKELMDRASYPEQQLIKSRLQEKGMWPGVGNGDERRRAAARTLDDLLSVHDDDEEAWFARAQLAVDRSGKGYFTPVAFGQQTLFGGDASSVPYYKALLRINPLHPAANHELVHYYENAGRPALGWLYSEKYIESSPGLPHAWHMQAHLATRLGRWDKATSSSLKAAELQRAFNLLMKVKPQEDHQFSHHLEILQMCLTHEGRYTEARKLKAECEGYKFRHQLPWFRLHLAERDYEAALKISDEYRKVDKTTASYLAALVYLAQNNPARALPEIEVLEQSYNERRNNRELRHRLWETRGCWLCQTGCADLGLSLLAKVVNETKDDYRHHAWGNGAYYMETWGLAALTANKLDVAEEAFLEALAHDSGSVRAALGLQTLCERQNRHEEAAKYAALAKRFWKHADAQAFQTERTAIRGLPLVANGSAGN